MANQYLALSLFIMLLSFFIILNSMSDFEDSKANPVLSSLDMAFSSGAVERDRESPSIEPAVDKSTQEGSTLERIENLFENNIRNFKVTKNRFGTEMQITMPLSEFEEALQSTEQELLSDESGEGDSTFLGLLVSLVQSEETGAPYRMDMVITTGQEPSTLKNETPEILQGYSQKATSFSRFLEGKGLPKRFISTGLAGGEADYVQLMFRLYEPITIGLVETAKEENERSQQ